MKQFVYMDGHLVPRREAAVSVFDPGFLYGDSIFETMRVYGNRVFRLEQHLIRLCASARILGLPMPVSLKELEKAVYATIQANIQANLLSSAPNLDAPARLRLTLARRENERENGDDAGSHLIISLQDYVPYSKEKYDKGFSAVVVSVRQDARSPLAGIKSGNFLENILARKEAHAKGVDEGILLNTDGYLAEAAMSNIFLIADDVVATPSRNCGILPGITRDVVFELSARLSFTCLERVMDLAQLENAQEIFVTNSLIEIMPVTMVNQKPVGNGFPGVITRKLMEAYRKLVDEETCMA